MFYQSWQHVGCLQKLEMAVRLRRGLSVVIGEVGTGKSTLCRRLIQRLHDDGGAVGAHLILDPECATADEFLATVRKALGIRAAADGPSWRTKDEIERHLFHEAVEKGRIPVLIIDEGQKLPGFAVEILRELLNYETNEYKLLQIIIFAQREFEDVIKKRANFADRITSLHRLGPFGLADTKKMIRFRLRQATVDGEAVPRLFTPAALAAVYWLTRGYPRKIVTLCSKVVMALVVSGRRRAGAALVLRCARETSIARRRDWWRAVPAVGLALGALLFVIALPPYHWQRQAAPQGRRAEAQEPAKRVAAPAPAAVHRPEKSRAPAAVAADRPEILGTARLEAGDNLSKMIARIYGRYSTRRLALVLAANPHIADSNHVAIGTRVAFPLIADAIPAAGDGFMVQLAGKDDLASAHAFVKEYPAAKAPLVIFPSPREGASRLSICLDRFFEKERDARAAIAALPRPYREQARVIPPPAVPARKNAGARRW